MNGPQGLRSLSLKTIYVTGNDDLRRDFFVPLLTQSKSYDRGVGYFTSGWLSHNAEGLAHFAKNGGHVRWVTSPILAPKDLVALSQAESIGNSPQGLESLYKTVNDLRTALEVDTLNTMAWMVADNLLEFRFAVPTNALDGDFHDKFGTFGDDFGQRISFLGSYNDTMKGFRNFESIHLFYSWDRYGVDSVSEYEQRFARIWLDREENLKTFRLPEAIRQRILQERTSERPYREPVPNEWQPRGLTLRDFSPRPYQQAAIDAWVKNNRRGILDMATGTGKTVTALTAISKCEDVGYIVIGAPSRQLVTQWLDSLKQVDGIQLPIEISSNNPNWQNDVLPRLRLAGSGRSDRKPYVFVGTYQSLSGKRFQELLMQSATKPNLGLLVADEVHNAGAPTFQRLLSDVFHCRLGLTATLDRAYDEVGTQVLLDYFDGIVYQMTMSDAVGSILCHYDYKLYFAPLTETEFEEYKILSQKIAHAGAQANKDTASNEDQEAIERLLLQRSRIGKLAEEKLEMLRQIIDEHEIRRCLIYCADMEQVEAVQTILAEARVTNLPFTSRQSTQQREATLRQLARDEIQAIVAIECLDEGVDVPEVEQAILLASSTSDRQFVQRRGRILRKSEGKTKAHLIDLFTVPPHRHHERLPSLIFSELRRALLLAQVADNRYEAENCLHDELRQFGIPIEEILGEYATTY